MSAATLLGPNLVGIRRNAGHGHYDPNRNVNIASDAKNQRGASLPIPVEVECFQICGQSRAQQKILNLPLQLTGQARYGYGEQLGGILPETNDMVLLSPVGGKIRGE